MDTSSDSNASVRSLSTPTRTLADPSGRFRASVTLSAVERVATVFVRAPSYVTFKYSVALDSVPARSKDGFEIALGVLRLRRAPAEPRVDSYTETTSRSMMSGDGESFSAPTQICSNPPRPGFVVQSADFSLRGDRSCNSWATCEKETQTEAQVCYTVRLQGHSECKPRFRGFGISISCAPARLSTAVLRTVYVFNGRPAPVFITYRQRVLEDKAREICSALNPAELRCADPLQLLASYSTWAQASGPNDSLLEPIRSLVAKAGFNLATPLPSIEVLGSKGSPQTYEVWLDADTK